MRPFSLACVGATLALSAADTAQAQSLICGVDCGAGNFLSCNDSLELTGGPTNASCSASLGSCTGETFCATLGHELSPSAFPIEVEGLVLVMSDGTPMSANEPFELLLFEERGVADPGPQIGQTYSLSIPGSLSRAIQIDLTSMGFQPYTITNPGPFRVCLRKGFDAGHNICLDTDGAAVPGRNWAQVSVALDPNNPCGSQIVPLAWYEADGTGSPLPSFPGIQGDFILRARIRPANINGVPGGADCNRPGEDMGDVGSDDVPDMGVEDIPDTGPADRPEVGVVEPDTGGGVTDAPPIVETLSPTSVPEGQSTELVITGRNFAAGVTAVVGNRPLVGIRLFGSTTLRGNLETGLAPGVYDLLVENPDMQVAIINDAFTVEGQGEPIANESDGCRCADVGGLPSVPSLLLLAAILVLGYQSLERAGASQIRPKSRK